MPLSVRASTNVRSRQAPEKQAPEKQPPNRKISQIQKRIKPRDTHNIHHRARGPCASGKSAYQNRTKWGSGHVIEDTTCQDAWGAGRRTCPCRAFSVSTNLTFPLSPGDESDGGMRRRGGVPHGGGRGQLAATERRSQWRPGPTCWKFEAGGIWVT